MNRGWAQVYAKSPRGAALRPRARSSAVRHGSSRSEAGPTPPPNTTERVLAAIAHGAIGFGLLGIGFLLSLAISGGLWLASLRLPYLRVQADRAGRYQIFVLLANVTIAAVWGAGLGLLIYLGGWEGWVGGGMRALAWGLLALVLALTLPLFVLWYAVTIGYGLYAGARVLTGIDWHYRWRRPGARRT